MQRLAFAVLLFVALLACREREVPPPPGHIPPQPAQPESADEALENWLDHLIWCPGRDNDSTSRPPLDRDDLVGEWFNDSAVPNTGGEWYAFLADGSYVDLPDVLDCSDRLVARIGHWHYRGNALDVTVTHIVTASGGTVEPDGADLPSTVVAARPLRTRLVHPISLNFRLVQGSDEQLGGGHLRATLQSTRGLHLWKYSALTDEERFGRYATWIPTADPPRTIDLDSNCVQPI